MSASPIIAHRGEFVDVLRAVSRGHVLVKLGDHAGGCVIDDAPVYFAWPALQRYGLIDEFDNPEGFAAVRYYRLSARGREFAQRVCAAWRSWPLVTRLATRLVG